MSADVCPRCNNPYWPPRSPVLDEPGDPLADAHKAGAARHRPMWLKANEAAIGAADRCGLDYTLPENSILLSRIVLAVLDSLPSQGNQP